jgi:adenylylsulfate kinase
MTGHGLAMMKLDVIPAGRAGTDLNGVIWIAGYSGSGKTTVSRLLVSELERRGAAVILLDGDDLRGIFGRRWGYERADRIELGYVNYRLCRYLSAQGYAVVIAAGGMYQEILDWNRANIPHFFQVYLDVPEDERRHRDAHTKKVYGQLGDVKRLFDTLKYPDLVIENYGDTDPAFAARQIADCYVTHRRPAEMARKQSV